MTRVIALMALTALGLSEAPVHEPVHGRTDTMAISATQRYRDGQRMTRPPVPSRSSPGCSFPGRRRPRRVPNYYSDEPETLERPARPDRRPTDSCTRTQHFSPPRTPAAPRTGTRRRT